MRQIIGSLNRNPRQRSTAYGSISQEREEAGLQAGELTEIINTPAKKYERKTPASSLVKNDLIEALNVSGG